MYESWQSISYNIAYAPSEDSDQPAHSRNLIGVFCRPPEYALDIWLHTECPAETLIRLRGCVGWFESSQGTHMQSCRKYFIPVAPVYRLTYDTCYIS